MLRAVIFDFNGIIVDDEPIHFKLFQKVLGEEGITLTEDAYYARYLGFDDRGAFTAGFRDNKRLLDDAKIAELIERKAVYYQDAIRNHVSIFPGVTALVSSLVEKLPLAVASGALRHEIEIILKTAGLLHHFNAIVSAEDVIQGKPAPDIFLKALAALNAEHNDTPIEAADCVVIEDSKEGIRGARRAGMKCLAVTNSHPAELLSEANVVVKSLEEVDLSLLQKICG
jgi:HAD superfamily hydrolase (TIGR01509 family)